MTDIKFIGYPEATIYKQNPDITGKRVLLIRPYEVVGFKF